ncbi:small multi-drug export protein [Egicoccus sp. AB-alg2]|uniref:small multi-drug export protein n=1 Tax=Egicoccus sp. AB-alg2 TaxID=3242693 RepID=UPI00359D733F
MTTLLTYLGVFVAAAIPWLEVLLVVPAGIVAGLPAVPVVVVAALGNAATLVPLVLAGDRLRAWWRRRRGAGDVAADDVQADGADGGPTAGGRGARARRVFDRYGLPGLAVLGPLLTGIHVAAVVALAAGAERRRTLLWLTAGLTVWAVLAAAATLLGLDTFVDRESLPRLPGT